jgi:hypothetical protein
MDQRQSIPIVAPSTPIKWTANGKLVAAASIGRYMLCSGEWQTPVIFADTSVLNRAVAEAFDYGQKMSNPTDSMLEHETMLESLGVDKTLKVTPICGKTTTDVIAEFMGRQEPAVCLFVYENNTLCVVGSDPLYYMIDLANNCFAAIDSPEFDVLLYANDYGDTNVSAYILEVPPPVVPVPTVAIEPPKKKQAVGRKKPEVVEVKN